MGKILRSMRHFVVGVWMELLIPSMMIKVEGGDTSHPCWVSNGLSQVYFQFYDCDNFGELVITICKFKEFYFKIGIGFVNVVV